MAESQSNTQNVFVIYGRNDAARKAMFEFLRSLDLNPLDWDQVIKATRKASPYIGEVLQQGFSMAQAAVAVFTPDDEARLKKEFWQLTDGPHEKEFSGQPRQNVLFEAGMAMGKYEDRTIIVEIGKLRHISDIAGRYVIRMDGSKAKRNELADRLHTAGCSVNTGGTKWHTAGDFVAAVAGAVSPELVADDDQSAKSEMTSPTKDDGFPRNPTAADFVNMGEHLWYLSQPPHVHVDNVINTIRGFLTKLDACKLSATRTAASPLESINSPLKKGTGSRSVEENVGYLTSRERACPLFQQAVKVLYDLRTNYISPVSIKELYDLMRPIRSVLEKEAKGIASLFQQ